MPQNNSEQKKTAAEVLLGILNTATLTRDDNFDTYALLPKKETNKSLTSLDSEDFVGWISSEYFKQTKHWPPNHDLKSTISHAKREAKKKDSFGEIHLRFGFFCNTHFIDMCNNNNEAVEITSSGWNVTNNLPVYFRNVRNQRELATPVRNGNYRDIRHSMNIDNEEDEILLLPTICTLPMADIIRPIIGFVGHQGSAKTTASRVIRLLLDPTYPIENDFKRAQHDLALVFTYNALPVFDNLTTISDTVSDMFCRAHSGTGFDIRAYYDDSTVKSFGYRRGMLFTAINPPTLAKDFNERTVQLELSRISDTERTGEKELLARFMARRPSILGGMLDVIVQAKRLLPKMTFDWRPRWADAFELASAAAEVMGYGATRYRDAVRDNLAARATRQNSSHWQEPALEAILSLMSAQGNFVGTPTDLLTAIAPYRPRNLGPAAEKKWPDSVVKLGLALNHIKADLEEAGVALSRKTPKGKTKITLDWLTTAAPTAQEAVVADEEAHEADAIDTVTFAADELGGVAFEDVNYDAIGLIPEVDPDALPDVVDLDIAELVAPVIDELPLTGTTAATDSVQDAHEADDAEKVLAIESTAAPDAPSTTALVIPVATSAVELEPQAVEEVDEDVCKFWSMGDKEVPCCSAKNGKALWTNSECAYCDEFIARTPHQKKSAKADTESEEFGIYQSAFK